MRLHAIVEDLASAEIAAQRGIDEVLISISHTDTHAMASAIGIAK